MVKSGFTADADAETKKKLLIHSKVKTLGCVSPRTCKYSFEHANQNCKIIKFGSDFGQATFRTTLAKRFWDTSPFHLVSYGICS